MEFFAKKVVSEDILVTYTAYVEADSEEEAREKIENDSDEIDWTEHHNEYKGGITRSIELLKDPE